MTPLSEAIQTLHQQREPWGSAEEAGGSPDPASARDPRLNVGPHRLAVAGETEEGGGELARRPLAEGGEYRCRLLVALERWSLLLGAIVLIGMKYEL